MSLMLHSSFPIFIMSTIQDAVKLNETFNQPASTTQILAMPFYSACSIMLALLSCLCVHELTLLLSI